MKRRSFLTWLSASAAAGAAAVWYFFGRPPAVDLAAPEPTATPPAPPTSGLPARFSEILSAMVDRLVPPGDGFPGALELGAFVYIQRELGRPEMAASRRLVMRGAPMLDRLCRELTGVSFLHSTAEARDEVIAAMAAGQGEAPRFKPAEFVRFMLALTLEGMFGDPAHGGNKDEAGWQALSYSMHPPRPTACLEPGGCE